MVRQRGAAVVDERVLGLWLGAAVLLHVEFQRSRDQICPQQVHVPRRMDVAVGGDTETQRDIVLMLAPD